MGERRLRELQRPVQGSAARPEIFYSRGEAQIIIESNAIRTPKSPKDSRQGLRLAAPQREAPSRRHARSEIAGQSWRHSIGRKMSEHLRALSIGTIRNDAIN